LPGLNGSKNTIFGRLLKGTRTVHQIEGIDEVRQIKRDYEKIKDNISENSTSEKFGLFRKRREYGDQSLSKITISNSGVYKIGLTEAERMRTSAVGQSDFIPLDFMEKRKNK
jgi:hypothetical protein